MMKTINGSAYRDMISYGVHHLDKHCAVVNDLNVFPVPDGDTGTNMVMTMRGGLNSIGDHTDTLSNVARSFANAAVFGARGNSGVILSQFFKGISEGLDHVSEADCADFVRALEAGCEHAYAAVSKPVEGTILTVMRDATAAVRADLDELHTINDMISLFLKEANRSLENTPRLLPILKKAGVVDSGGAGLVYFFEGVRKYLDGEEADAPVAAPTPAVIDYTAFHRDSDFSLGYCTELLLQLTDGAEPFDYAALVSNLQGLGESLVTSLELDKVKIHIHTAAPEQILAHCHRYGEFLSLKIENMSVQNATATQKILCSETAGEGKFAVVAVAPNAMLQTMLSQMGADAVIQSSEAPSSGEFIEAFRKLGGAKDILVFPNSSNSILSAMQAGSLYKDACITVLNCRSIPECYAALAILDFDAEDIHGVVREVNDTIANAYEVAIVHATKNIKYGKKYIVKNDYFALCKDEILESADSIENVVLCTARTVLKERECSVLTLFYGQNVTEEAAAALADKIGEQSGDVETCLIPTQNPVYDLILLFE